LTGKHTETGARPVHAASKTEVALALAAHDVRQRRAALVLLLRLTTVRQIARIVSLLAVDYVGLAAALCTALIVKTALQANPNVGEVWRQTEQWVAFGYVVTALMFARLDLYADRRRRQRLGKVPVGLSQAAVVSLIFALASDTGFCSGSPGSGRFRGARSSTSTTS